jgi:transcription elongation GreA/GreB family factor
VLETPNASGVSSGASSGQEGIDMTVATTGLAAGAVTQAVRRQVRRRLEEELRRLTEVERPALLAQFDGAADDTDLMGIGRAIALVRYRIAEIQNHLNAEHEPHPRSGICPRCCVLIDRGEGPKWSVLAALPETGLPVISSDSALGRALIGARPGESVEYPDPTGIRIARVLDTEPAVDI